MEGQRADDDVVGFGLEFEVLDGHAPVFRPEGSVLPVGLFQHFFGRVDAGAGDRAVFDGIAAVPAVSAAEIEYPFAAEVGQHFFQNVPFSGTGQAVDGTGHAAVFAEEAVVVIGIGPGGVFFFSRRFSGGAFCPFPFCCHGVVLTRPFLIQVWECGVLHGSCH